MDEIVARMMPVRACNIVSGFVVSSAKVVVSTTPATMLSLTDNIGNVLCTGYDYIIRKK